jgi:hypothetical protein
MRKALEGAKGKTIHRPWMWVKFVLLHHELIVVGHVMFEGKKNLQGHPWLGARLPKKRRKKKFPIKDSRHWIELSNVNLQVDEDLLASLNSSRAWTSITSSIDVVLKGQRWWARKRTYWWGIMRYQTFGYLEPNVKSMIIIVIFTHKEIQVGCVMLLHYLMYILYCENSKWCWCVHVLFSWSQHVIMIIILFLSWRMVNFKNKFVFLYACEW